AARRALRVLRDELPARPGRGRCTPAGRLSPRWTSRSSFPATSTSWRRASGSPPSNCWSVSAVASPSTRARRAAGSRSSPRARAEAARLARRHLEIFAGAEAVVCPSASCVATVRHRYAELVGDADARALAERTFELGEFLLKVLNKADVGARFPHRVALLESC